MGPEPGGTSIDLGLWVALAVAPRTEFSGDSAGRPHQTRGACLPPLAKAGPTGVWHLQGGGSSLVTEGSRGLPLKEPAWPSLSSGRPMEPSPGTMLWALLENLFGGS